MSTRCVRAREALRLGLTEKFLAEDQPPAGQHGHMRAALAHRRASQTRSALCDAERPARPCAQRSHVWQAHAAARRWRAGPAWGTRCRTLGDPAARSWHHARASTAAAR